MSLWSRIERRLSDLAGEIIPDEFREQVLYARRLLEDDRPREAAETLEALLGERPGHVGALSLLGAARLALGDAPGARRSFEDALERRPDLPEALIGRGESCLLLRDWRTAAETFQRAVQDAGGDRSVLALAYRGRGLAFRRLGELDKAIRELRKALAEDPDDTLARGTLGEALLADPAVSTEEARLHLSRALEGPAPPPIVHVALGRLALRDGLAGAAREHFDAVLADVVAGDLERRLDALIGRADAALLEDAVDEAARELARAEELDPRHPDVHARVGDVLRRQRRFDDAFDRYQRALDLGGDDTVLRRALRAATRANRIEALVRLANHILERDPDDPEALVARGRALAAEGQREPARATFRAALRQADDLEAHLALGQLELDEDATAAAAEALAALRIAPDSERGRALLERARARELGRADTRDAGHSELYRLAAELQHLLGARSELAPLSADAARAAADFDRPLLVTVMGEFSSGKSTFVNAFIGHDVAPTGITPTTATINIVKYGRERGGRILYRSGDTETVSWDALFPRLRELDAGRARAIELVEILLPLEQLERINLVDTPGLNSILPEHEDTARDFIGRADAVVWLFTAGQAGKDSERRALESIHREGKRVLGVLNKVDQLDDDQTREVTEHVANELGQLVDVVVPVSARRALADSAEGNWPGLYRVLEDRFFARARELKRQACSHRLGALIARGRAVMDERRVRAREAGQALRASSAGTRGAGETFIDRVVAQQRRELNQRVGHLYRRAAREVLELVRPRRSPFGSHQATVADRDYLVALLDNGFESVLESSRREVLADLRERGGDAVGAAGHVASLLGSDCVSDVTRTAEDAVRLVEAQVFVRTRAYLRGYLRGGFVDAFFRSVLPKLELEEDHVYHALFRDSPDVDAEIALPLATAGVDALEALAARLAHWAGVAEVMAFDVEVGILRALDELDERRRSAT